MTGLSSDPLWQCATGGYVHVWYSHRYAYSPLVTEPNDYGKSVCLDDSGPQQSIL